jgi:peptidoglycan hydrolase CwlO-like protein
MEKLINELLGAFLNEEKDVKFEKGDNGDITIFITTPKTNEEILNIRKELDEMDDDIFEESAELLKRVCQEEFATLQTLDNPNPNVSDIKNAYTVFKGCVEKVLQNKVCEYKAKITELNNKISEYSKEIAKLRK